MLLLWVGTAVSFFRLFTQPPATNRLLAGLLAFHWAWAGVVYHLIFFRRINPAAAVFGAAFVLQAMLILWRRPAVTFYSAPPVWRWLGLTCLLYAMLYPGLGLLLGLRYPRLPTFGLPCPTTILTAGWLLLIPRAEARILGGLPVIWAGIGGSAAFVLGIRTDLMLPVAGLLVLAYMVTPGSVRKRHL